MNTAAVDTKRHSYGHILAAAVLEMFPEAKLAIGPSIENGFYYDFDLPRTLIPEDLPLLQKAMKQLIKTGGTFERTEVPIADALAEAKKNKQIYKAELIEDLSAKGEKTVSFYRVDGFVDLCAGPHVESLEELDTKAFKLVSIAGAYWKGSEKNKMLQRIYGIAFDNSEELAEYERFQEEAKKRDHKLIGRQQDLFSFHPEAPGMPFWHEKGMIIWNELEKFGKGIRKNYGFIEIKTPILAKNTLWVQSGHWDHYKDDMFSFNVENETYCLKPMDCPFNIKIYQTMTRSYKDLPIRYTEIGHVHRNEKSGELNGLFRVREITQDDSHIFCREDQIETEISNLIKMTNEFYVGLGIEPMFYLSTRPDDFMGEIKTWDKAEKDLKVALDNMKINYELKEGDGAFYGPKIDVDLRDSMGRNWQVATIQLDFQLPGRFGCEYTDETGGRKTPIMIHAAIFGSFERMTGILIEHYAGALPVWLSPVQVRFLPIADRHVEHCQAAAEKLREAGVRVEVDDTKESVGKKIRNAELAKIPYMLVVGDQEIEFERAAVRSYADGDLGQLTLEDLIKKIV